MESTLRMVETKSARDRDGRGPMLHALVLALLLPASAIAQTTTRVSVDSSGTEANDSSDAPVISSDGRFVVFTSLASDLVAGDANGAKDVFVHDRLTGTTECVSVDSSGIPGNAMSGGSIAPPSISADGRFVSFVSYASNLVAGTTTSGSQIFVRDRSTGVTELASIDSSGSAGNGASWDSSLSADGRLVAFDSYSWNLVGGDTNASSDIFVHDRTTGITERVSVDSAGRQGSLGSYFPSLSADGFSVAFSSVATDLVPNDKNHQEDAFLHDRRTGTTERVSVDSAGVEGNGDSQAGGLSADGQVVVFTSLASNLISNDANRCQDIFIRDRSSGLTVRVSVDSTGAEANGTSAGGSISADATIVAFHADASNLVAGDNNGCVDAFVHDRSTDVTSRVSVDGSGGEADSDCWGATLSADGRAVSFSSVATDLVANDTNGYEDVFVRDDRVASWFNYGAGFPGTNGIPSFTSSADPVIGTTITLTLGNSRLQPTVGLVCAGSQRATIPSSFGGDLLVAPILALPITFSFGQDQFDWSIPSDFGLLGIAVDLQAIEADPGAVKGVSFTAGLELVVGL